MKTVAFVIHLERSTERQSSVRQIQGSCPIPTYTHLAVDGIALPEGEVAKHYVRSLFNPVYPFQLKLAEIGLFLSYRACWQRMLVENIDAALILEDDSELGDNFKDALYFAMDSIIDLGFIKFPVRKIGNERVVVDKLVNGQHFQLLEPLVVPLATDAQLISRETAEKLLNVTERFDRPIDTFLQMRQVSGQRVFVIQPSGVRESAASVVSTIHNRKKREMQWINREMKRLVYRMRVRYISWRNFGGDFDAANRRYVDSDTAD